MEPFVELLVQYGHDLYGSGRPYYHRDNKRCHGSEANTSSSGPGRVGRSVHVAGQGTIHPSCGNASFSSSCSPLRLPGLGMGSRGRSFRALLGALLRVSKATRATRGHLVFPADAFWMQTFVLGKIDEPKTRGRAAKHQAAKLEPSDLVSIVSLAFESLPKTSRLWPHSNQSLRKRFDTVLERLQIPTARGPSRPLDLGSLRPGGATFLLQFTEDSELARRRGRWVSHRLMEIYLQEVAASTFVADLPEAARSKVLYLVQSFSDILKQVQFWSKVNIPSQCWSPLWT